MKRNSTIILIVSLFFIGCSHSPQVVFPNRGYQDIKWTKIEKEKNIAVRNLFANEYSSAHLIRLKGKERPHYHDRHNLTVMVISGKSILHFQDHEVILYKGDSATIPKGTYHWAENLDSEASVVFATFSPAYRGKDKRLAR